MKYNLLEKGGSEAVYSPQWCSIPAIPQSVVGGTTRRVSTVRQAKYSYGKNKQISGGQL